MKANKLLLFLLVLLCGTEGSNGQTRLADSLRIKLSQTLPASEKIRLIMQLSNQSINPDTLLPYLLMADSIAAVSQLKQEKENVEFIKANYYIRENHVDSALFIINGILSRYENNAVNKRQYLDMLFFKAKILDRGNRYTDALRQLYLVLKVAQIQKDTLTIIQAKTGIGWVQMEMEQYPEALRWLESALHTSSNNSYYHGYGALYSNLASTYNALGKTALAYQYIDIAIREAKATDNELFLATAMSIKAKILIDHNQQELAETLLTEVVNLRKKFNDPFYTVFDMSSLASFYASIGQTQKGIRLCMEGIQIAKENKLSSQLLMMYHSLAENYKAAGNTGMYAQTLEDIIQLKDSFNNINSAKLLGDMQANTEAQKKQQEILKQKMDLTQKNYLLIGSAIFGTLIAVIALLLFWNYRRRQTLKMNQAFADQKRNEAEAVRMAEEKERTRIAADLHDNLGAYAASLAANLNYLQPTIEAEYNALAELQSNSGAIISELNDTIWVLKKESLLLTAISDRVKQFINRIKRSYPSKEINVKENITDNILLPSSQAFHLYRLIQEGVNNALKHSEGKNILVHIISTENWEVMIEDDGVGMPVTAMQNGNGIYNMNSRTTEAGWQISWQAGIKGGTRVSIQPKLSQ
ncbi:MAG: hypothetical protein IPL97_06915 [Niastella sp.]|nr:hypothetical protein [Niastella sp.]